MSRPRLDGRVGPRGVFCGLLVARRVGQRFDPRSRPPQAPMEAVFEALIETRLIELRQASSMEGGFHQCRPTEGHASSGISSMALSTAA
jgi:hypothetical protein